MQLIEEYPIYDLPLIKIVGVTIADRARFIETMKTPERDGVVVRSGVQQPGPAARSLVA